MSKLLTVILCLIPAMVYLAAAAPKQQQGWGRPHGILQRKTRQLDREIGDEGLCRYEAIKTGDPLRGGWEQAEMCAEQGCKDAGGICSSGEEGNDCKCIGITAKPKLPDLLDSDQDIESEEPRHHLTFEEALELDRSGF